MDSNGLAPVRISGSINNTQISPTQVRVDIGGSTPTNIPVQGDTYSGAGSVKVTDPSVSYSIIDADNNETLGGGTLTITPVSDPAGSQSARAAVAYLSLLAAVVEATRWLLDSLGRRER